MFTRRRFLGNCAAGVGLLSYSGILPALFAEQQIEPFGDVVVIQGPPRERGRKYGEHFQAAIHHFLEREIYAAFEKTVFSKDELLRYAGACFQVIREECPIIADELEGMAEGT